MGRPSKRPGAGGTGYPPRVSTESNASTPSRALPIVLVKRGVHAAWLGTILFVLAFADAYVSAIISTLFKYAVGDRKSVV